MPSTPRRSNDFAEERTESLTASDTTRAAELHRQAIVIDGHSDILMAVAAQRLRLGDRFPLPESKGWEAPLGWYEPPEAAMYDFSKHTSYFQTMGQYDLPRFREGGLTAQGMAIYIESTELNRALENALEMVYWLDREFAEIEDFEPVLAAADIRRIKAEGKVGGILTFEGFEPLGANLHLLDIFYKLGLRMATMTHSRRNYFADGTQAGVRTTGLTEAGVAAVKRMNELGIVIDFAHLAPAGCLEVLEITQQPVIFSHASPRRSFRGDPSGEGATITKKIYEGVVASGGLIGIIAWSQPTLGDFVDEIETIITNYGDDYVGLGTDFFGVDQAPTGFTGMQDLPAVTEELVRRGHSDETILKVLGGNYLRVFESVWGA
jgi:membrane dipeptidase